MNTIFDTNDRDTKRSCSDELLELARVTYTEGDRGDSALLVEAFGGEFVYDTNFKDNEGWFSRKGHYWERVPAGKMRKRVMDTLPDIYKDAAKKVTDEANKCKDTGVDDDDPELMRLRAEANGLRGHAKGLNYNARAGAVLSVASAFDEVMVDRGVWDREQYIIAFQNCVVDIRTGEKVEPNPKHFITRVLPVEWHGLDAPCPTYDQFMLDLFADKGELGVRIAAFLDRLIGVALAGDAPKLKRFPNFIGERGDNAKSTLLNIWGRLFGPFGAPFNKSLLLRTRNEDGERPTPALYSLMQQRIGWCTESNRGDVLDGGALKRLTGNDPVSARTLHQRDMTVFVPQFLLILATNHRLRTDTSDDPLWKRLLYIDFGMQFMDNPDPNNPKQRKADPNIDKKVLAEAPGILARFVRGYIAYLKDGLQIPEELLDSTKEARKEEDIYERFFADECVRLDGVQVGGKEFWDAFSLYQHEGDYARKINKNEFGTEMKKRFRFVDNPKVVYFGIGLKADVKPTDVPDQAWVQNAQACALAGDFDGAERAVANIKDRTLKGQTGAIIGMLRSAKTAQTAMGDMFTPDVQTTTWESEAPVSRAVGNSGVPPKVDYAYVERLLNIGNIDAIKTHCFQCRVDMNEVIAYVENGQHRKAFAA